ncbi:MAG TPA: biotin carboxylase N-terminal domain-containing protein [Acidimicrobiales bacterium]|nr:biotin carboxylase N-terminal domain-containing protein [Acidimicrobiales bacterium]
MAFDTLLVANRGEVALRVIRAARRLGLRSVAVYSDADIDSPHVVEADRAVRIGPPPAAQSYLSIGAILRAAHEEGAGAVHPGYGFLAENGRFAAACEEAGLVFVGPQPEVIELMSRKDRAREVALEAGAPLLRAVQGKDPAVLAARVADEIGFPALVKAVAGGGGKGMRVATTAADLEPALAGAGREALGAFGDASLFVERYVPGGHHLEVQVVGDGTGRVVHLFDRDCSVQRRHQKVVEEAPASVNSPVARAMATDAALRLAAHVSYRSLGTVEFLALGDEVFFLEVNTRLQVEHPVTEAITGIDLVELQLRLANGEPLTLSQDEVAVNGHAIEVRVYAEDPEHGFLPQAGRADLVRWPAGARVEAALEAGQEVGSFYDPMVAKVITHGGSREAARLRMVDALDRTAILGLTTNAGFLRRLVASESFAGAAIHTSWLDEHPPEHRADDWRVPLVAAALFLVESSRRQGAGDPFGPDGWRPGGPAVPTLLVLSAGEDRHELLVGRRADHDDGDQNEEFVEVDGVGPRITVRGARVGADSLSVELDGQRQHFFILAGRRTVLVSHQGACYRFERGQSRRFHHDSEDELVVAPLPGVLVAVSVSPGDPVGAGHVLGVLESMKMEYPLKARFAATVARVGFGAGARVARGDVLFELVPSVPGQGTPAPIRK